MCLCMCDRAQGVAVAGLGGGVATVQGEGVKATRVVRDWKWIANGGSSWDRVCHA